MSISRRAVLFGMPLFVAACTSAEYQTARLNYAAMPEEEFPLRAVPLSEIKPELRRQEVAFDGDYEEGTIVVNTPERRLYYVLGDGRAIRYGIGVGREGLALSGNATVGRKAEWPDWRPPAEMIARQPYLPRMTAGGPGNPLGARALYLYRGGRDTMFRIHGTNQPNSIGHAMSSGCVRMLNHDVIDLYERAERGTRVVVIQA